MAAAVLANRAIEISKPELVVTSSGTSSWHIGESAHELSQKTWRNAGYKHAHIARQFTVESYDQIDLILAMDLSNHANILQLARNDQDREKVALLRSFDPNLQEDRSEIEVPDPWGNDIGAYQEVLLMVESAVTGLLTSLRR